MRKPSALLLAVLISAFLAGCNFALDPETPTPTASTTPSPLPTATETAAPTLTPSPSPSPTISLTPSRTAPPTETPIPTPVPTASATPQPAIGLANDQWTTIEVPERLQTALDRPYFTLVSLNERTGGVSSPETPMPDSELETLYLVDPSTGELVELFDLPISVSDRIYWAPDGRKLVYYVEPVMLADGSLAGGLYLINLDLGVSLRLFKLTSLNPRDIPEHRPVWSPDSQRLAVALPTAYDVDIFVVSADGSTFQNVTMNGAYDLWPAWSPDGSRMAFVSDRETCPTWLPGEPGSCSAIDAVPPQRGHVYVMDTAGWSAQRVSEIEVDGPPAWVSNLQVAFTTGLSDPFSQATELWLMNVQAGTARLVSGSEPSMALGAAWSSGGVDVMFYNASEPASLVLKRIDGSATATSDQYLFSRFGFGASWSPGGERVAFAGRNGQCPYGLIVANNSLAILYAGTAPRACDPSYSPDGNWLAYAGVQTLTGAEDGRLDLYMANSTGYGSRNLTSRLRGDIRLLGWVGPGA